MRQFLMIAVLVLLASSPARADWAVGDPYKMHFPQLPDPNGLDVNFESPFMLADDWLCTETGPVQDIHFWVSHRADQIPAILGLRVEIFANIPASPLGGFSRPGASLWSAGGPLPFNDFKFATAPGGTGSQGWYDPLTGQYIPNDHHSYFQINLTDITEPFIQQKGQIYWFGVSINTTGDDGWKTADLNSYPAPYTGMHFEDDAVFRGSDGSWRELRYPSGHPRGGQSIDLAFVITNIPEPASFLLMAFAAIAIVCRRCRGR
jgi:hypothetical protein